MKQSPFYFEIKDLLTQFVAAFDDIVIKRYNDNRRAEDQIQVRYVYSPKQRVMYDIVNLAKTITIPAVAVSIKSIARDNDRVFNKLEGFYYRGDGNTATHLRSPVPINISVEVSIIARYQNDMDQILSNFVPYANPYIVIGWKMPTGLGLPKEQEIRSEVLWDGTVSMNYPTDIAGNEKARITADTSFTIKGWLFKDTPNPVGKIYYIDTSFQTKSLLTDYGDLSGTEVYPISSGLYTETESFELSASPSIANVFLENVMLYGPGTIQQNTSANILLQGYMFTDIAGIILSASNTFSYTTPVTAINGFKREATTINGTLLTNYRILNDNVVSIITPPMKRSTRFILIPFNKAGYATTTKVLNSQSLSANGTFIIVN